jgi:hypothetical protein
MTEVINDLRLSYNSLKIDKSVKIPEPPPVNIKDLIDMILLSPDSKEIIIDIVKNNNLGDEIINYIKIQSEKNNNIEVLNTKGGSGNKKNKMKNKSHLSLRPKGYERTASRTTANNTIITLSTGILLLLSIMPR